MAATVGWILGRIDPGGWARRAVASGIPRSYGRCGGLARDVRGVPVAPRRSLELVGTTMTRVIAAMACGLTLAGCSMSMPSPRLLQVVAGNRAIADRIRAAGRGRQDLPGADLPHPLRADRTLRRGARRDGGDERISAADPAGSPGKCRRLVRPPPAQPAVCRAPDRGAAHQEGTGQEAHQRGRKTAGAHHPGRGAGVLVIELSCVQPGLSLADGRAIAHTSPRQA